MYTYTINCSWARMSALTFALKWRALPCLSKCPTWNRDRHKFKTILIIISFKRSTAFGSRVINQKRCRLVDKTRSWFTWSERLENPGQNDPPLCMCGGQAQYKPVLVQPLYLLHIFPQSYRCNKPNAASSDRDTLNIAPVILMLYIVANV